jgi:hypothetical protein
VVVIPQSNIETAAAMNALRAPLAGCFAAKPGRWQEMQIRIRQSSGHARALWTLCKSNTQADVMPWEFGE